MVFREVLSWDPNEISEFAINKKELFCFLLFRTAEYFVNKMFMHRLEGNSYKLVLFSLLNLYEK